MPYPPSSHTPTILAAAAWAVAGAATLAWGISYWHRCQQRHEGAASPGATWTVQQVAAWLRDNGVSKTSVGVCCRYKVDGDTLMQLTAQDLYNMGVPLRDARMILAALDDVKGTAILLSSVSPRLFLSRQSSRSLRAAQTAVHSSVHQFEAAWRALVRTCALPSSDTSPVEQQQQRLAVYAGALLESFRVLTASEQEAALSLVASAEKVPVFPPATASWEGQHRPAGNDALEDTSTIVQAVEAKLKPLHGMLDGFLGFLRSRDLDTVAPAEFEELGERVAAQVKRIVHVAKQLPPELSGPLLRKCDGVFEALSTRQRTSPDSSGNDEGAVRAKLMHALRNMFSTVEGPTLRELTPTQRLQSLSSLVKRAEAIEAVANGSVSGVPKDAEVLSTVQSLLRVLQEAIRVNNQEAEGDTQAAADEDGDEGKAPAAENADATGGPIRVIIGTVQDIQDTLQSEAFEHAPSAVKVELCTTLLQRVAVLEEKLVELPPPAQAMVRDLLLNTKNVLAVVMTTAETVRDNGDKGSLAGDEVQEEGQDNDSDVDAAQAEKNEGRVYDGDIDAHVEQLEKIFDFLTSDALEQATMVERQRVAAKLLQRVEEIRADLAAHGSQGTLIEELVGPLQNLLSDMAGDHAASREFLEMTAPLSDMRRLLTSKSFQQLPHAEKMRIARSFVPQLLQLTSSFSSLSDAERKAAEELVRPINEELLRMMDRRDPATRSAQEVLDRLQAVMHTVQGSEFTTMLPVARSAWAANTVAELGRMRDDCTALGADGAAVLPLIERLRSQLSGLLPDRTDAGGDNERVHFGESERGGDGANGEAPQEQEGAPADVLWVEVHDMCDALRAAEKAATTVPSERLQKMLRVMGQAVDLPGMSAQKGATLQEFGNLLRRHVEVMTKETKDRSGGAEKDAVEEDCTEAKAALDAFRRSLQALMVMVQDGSAVSATELSSLASKAGELIASANTAKIKWREDSWCTKAVRSILEALQQSRGIEEGAGRSRALSKVEAVLQSSTATLIANPPTSKEDFAPYMRLLQLAQSSAEQMTNRELMLLKNLQEAVIEAMKRLPEPLLPNGTRSGQEADNEEEEGVDGDEENRVEAVLDALQQMSYKLREGSFTAEELDEFEQVQQDLERLLADEGVEVEDAMEAVRGQIRMHRDRLESRETGDDGVEEVRNGEVAADVLLLEAEPTEKGTPDPLHQESADAFNEDDDDEVGSNGAAAASGLSSGFPQHTPDGDDMEGECRTNSCIRAS